MFGANRTAGLTNIASISGIITDITSSAYKGALVLSTADNAQPAERLRIDSAGNVGIGTTTPKEALHVNGHIVTPAGSVLHFNSTSTGGDKYLGSDSAFEIWHDSVLDTLRFGTAVPGVGGNAVTYSDTLALKDDGNVGIGTTAPTTKLDVVGGAVAAARNDIRTTRTDGVVLANRTASDATNTAQYSPSLHFQGSGWNTGSSASQSSDWVIQNETLGGGSVFSALTFRNSVNGGAYSTLGALDSVGNWSVGKVMNLASKNNALIDVANAGVNIARDVGDANPALYVKQVNAASTGDILQLRNNASTVFTVQQDGDVGIGTTSPGSKLEVNGNLKFTSSATIYTPVGADLTINGHNSLTLQYAGAANMVFNSGGATVFPNLTGTKVLTVRPASGQTSNVLVVQQNPNQGTATLFSVDGQGKGYLSSNLGIGMAATYPLDVAGDIRTSTCVRYAGGSSGTCSSDERFKHHITPLGGALDQLAALRPVSYEWRTDEFPERHFSLGVDYGLIAQDVEAVLPDLVTTDPDGYKRVTYGLKLSMLTIQAIKELKSAHEESLAAAQAEIASLRQKQQELERETAKLKAYLCKKDPDFCP